MTATAAGSASVWSPRIAVTAGTEYVVRVPIGIATSQTGLTVTATLEWWSASSGGTQLGTATSPAWNISSTVGFWAANYPVVVATAPAGATHALLKVSVNNLAASAKYLIDDVYFCAAPVKAGNAYGYNTASIEQDTSGWKIDSGTMVRGGWVLIAGQGHYGLEVTSAAAGYQEIRTQSFIGVIPGKEYTSYAAVWTDAGALPWMMEFRWYDASFVEVGLHASTTYTVSNSVVTRLGITGIAPAGSVYCKVFIRPQATAAGQRFIIDDASLVTSPNIAGNLLTYAEYSSEGILPDWTLTNGTASLYQLTSGITDGYFTIKAVPTVTGLITAQLNRLVPVTVGTTYQVKATFYRHSTDPAQKVIGACRTRVDWFDSAGNILTADNPDQFYSSEVAADWYANVISETRTCPEGAVYAKVGWEVTSDNPLIDFWVVDNISLMEAVPEYTLSTSNEDGSITLTVNNPYAPGSNNSNVTIKRVDDSGKVYSMRGYGRTWDLAPNPYSTIVVEDYEAPLASRVWYSIQWSSSTGATKGPRLFTQSVDTPVLTDADYAWFKSPGIPALNTTVMMEAPLKWSRAARSQRYDVVGRKNPINRYDVRSGRSSSITVLIWDPEANELFNSLLDSGAPALVQAMPGYGIDGNLYVAVGDVDCEPLDPDARVPGWRWTLGITEVDRPDGGLQGSAASTWQTILDSTAYPTWEELFNSHDTWTDVLTKG
ncbi:hypothetical protein [Streptomyces sp. IBSBF 3010]|uniref:hypothetical protein n=1 Tax=Streptomyces sp. IBSBF 3010 TaxID=2903526 RepID=UPI002FDC4566